MADEKICSFCSKLASMGILGIVQGKEAGICDECIVAAAHTLADDMQIPRTSVLEVLAYRQALRRSAERAVHLEKLANEAKEEFAKVERDHPELVHPNA
jgi:hypothetical protein